MKFPQKKNLTYPRQYLKNLKIPPEKEERIEIPTSLLANFRGSNLEFLDIVFFIAVCDVYAKI